MSVTLRHDLRPGDLGTVVNLHGTVYAAEYGFDVTFEAYVAGPLAEFALTRTDRDRLWLAERAGHIVGCVAIVGTSAEEAQLRWFLVAPEARGAGLGKRLLHEAISFCASRDYQSVFLWTVSALTAAASLYRSVGFQRVEATPAQRWGVPMIEEKYSLRGFEQWINPFPNSNKRIFNVANTEMNRRAFLGASAALVFPGSILTDRATAGPGYASPAEAIKAPRETLLSVIALYGGTGIRKLRITWPPSMSIRSPRITRRSSTACRCRASTMSCTTSAGTPVAPATATRTRNGAT